VSRLLPFLLVALVLGGLWLTRGGLATPAPTEPPAEAAQEAPEGEAALVLPEGFALVPPLTDTPRREFEAPEDVLEPGLDYAAILETSRGRMVVDLLEEAAPVTVNNFVFLALNRYYDGVVFHRVLEDFMAQTGDPTGTGSGGPGYQFANEIAPNLSHDRRGVVSMANAGPDTNGSQFFITFGEAPWLDGGYNIFGQVSEGEDVLDSITRIDPQTPSAIVSPGDTLGALAEQGIALAGEADQTLEAYLEASLGAPPVAGQTFSLDGYSGVLGRMGGEPALGFWPRPDVLGRVHIVARPK
jgi:cyclophilin family peptidyl-prolyl cis-trans isomerase